LTKAVNKESRLTAKVYIILVNWNGWQDTVECLESVLNSDFLNFHIVVCDNNSSDNSINHIKAWAEGSQIFRRRNQIFPGIIDFSLIKPIPYTEYSDNDIAPGKIFSPNGESKLTLIKNSSNLGFAGGNNVGIHYALLQGDCDYVWLLNNDTVIQQNSLSTLVSRMESDKTIGVCGSTLLYYHEPNIVQALGGATYNKWLALANHIGAHEPMPKVVDLQKIEKKMSYVIGASMLISRQVLSEIGLLNESYFLYCEEIDYCERAKKKYRLGYAPKSIVFHKEGVSTGAGGRLKQKKEAAEYHAVKSRLLFTRSFYPWCLPTVYLVTMFRIAFHMLRSDWNRVRMLIQAMFS